MSLESSRTSAVVLSGVRKAFGTTEIIKGIDLAIAPGELVVFVGPSGCGKSTLLRLVAGLEEVTSGRIRIGDDDITHTAPSKRGIAMVFQSYALFPHMTVAENISFGLRLKGAPVDEIATKVAKVADILQLTPLLDRRPKQLSGGQRQRAAIGRAIIRNPKVFLFDEPLSNLDAALRGQMRVEIARLHADLKATMIYVTHDQVEAMTLADRIVVLNAGQIEQVGTPMELYSRPANEFVAGFIGSPRMNFFDAVVERHDAQGATVRIGSATLDIARKLAVADGQPVRIGIRPEDLSFDVKGKRPLAEGRVIVVERLGGEILAYIASSASKDLLVVKMPGSSNVILQQAIGITADLGKLHVFANNGATLS